MGWKMISLQMAIQLKKHVLKFSKLQKRCFYYRREVKRIPHFRLRKIF